MIHLFSHFLARLSWWNPNRCNLKNPPIGPRSSSWLRCLCLSFHYVCVSDRRSGMHCISGVGGGGGGAGNLQVGFLSRGRGSEEGSKVTKSISCELLRASSVVTHRGSQACRGEGRLQYTPPPSFSCFLSLFLHFPSASYISSFPITWTHTPTPLPHFHAHMYSRAPTISTHIACTPATCTGL